MEEHGDLLPGWKLEKDVLSFDAHDVQFTVRVSTLAEARLAVMDFQDRLEDQGDHTVAAVNPDKKGMSRRGYLVEITKEGEPIAVQMIIDYPDESSEPDLEWLGSNMWPGQALVDLYPIGDTEEELVPQGFVVEDRRQP